MPHSLNPLPANAPHNRLGLAIWLTTKQNPLTARTMVNRVWEQCLEPVLWKHWKTWEHRAFHPHIRNCWTDLSWKFMNEYNWSIKKLLKEIVMSATYQAGFKIYTRSIWKKIHTINFMRGARVRLSAEQVRDQAL